MSKFNEGDKVRIVRQVEGDYGNGLFWAGEMSEYVNDGVVYEIKNPDWYGGVKLEDNVFSWPEEALELVE